MSISNDPLGKQSILLSKQVGKIILYPVAFFVLIILEHLY